MNAVERRIVETIDAHQNELFAFAKDLFAHPEPGFQETRTAQKFTEAMQALGLETQTELAVTGVKARLPKKAGKAVALLGELDAVGCPNHPFADAQTGVAHACGHHAQLTAVLGAAIALQAVQEELDGNVLFCALPAEEYVEQRLREPLLKAGKIRYSSGKSEWIRLGHFEEADLAVTTHVHMVDAGCDLLLGNSPCNGFIAKTVTIHGKAAHAAICPDQGVNALNVAAVAATILGMLRETFRESDYVRIHTVIKEGGNAVNVVPDHVVVEAMVRAASLEAVQRVSAQFDRAYRAAADAFGATVDIQNHQGYLAVLERAADPALLEAAEVLKTDCSVRSIPSGWQNVGSTDVGDLTHLKSVLNFSHSGVSGGLHSAELAIADPEKAYLLPAKMMALTVYHLLKEGGKEAEEIVKNFVPAMTKQEYCDLIESL